MATHTQTSPTLEEGSTRVPSLDHETKLQQAAQEPVAAIAETVLDGLSRDAPGGMRFWLIMISLMVSTFLSALDLTSVSTALPVIVEQLHGTDFVWVGSSFSLGSTAFLPLSGGLAQIFGRRIVLLGSLAFFAVGSALAAAAQSMNMLIAGRTIQGVGGGGILSLTEIIIADMVPLRLRGPYMGMIGAVWAIASAAGPPIGGLFAQSNWRWLFYLNLPIVAIAAVLVLCFLDLKVPNEDFRSKIRRMDWIGNFLVAASSTSTIVALAWAGVQYPWTSFRVLVPLILGFAGLGAFLVYEAKWATEPVVPWGLVSNRTSLCGYLTVFVHGIVSTACVYYFPVYFQGAQLLHPVSSGVHLFGVAFTIAPAAIVCGIIVMKTNRYMPSNFVGWIFTTVGFGILSILTVTSTKSQQIGFQIIVGIGLGILYAAPEYPVLAPLPINETAHALALFAFIRNFAQTFGVTVGSVVLQNELKSRLPQAFLEQVSSQGAEIAYSIIPIIGTIPEPLRTQVRDAFAGSVAVIWRVMIGVSGVGFLFVFGMREQKMAEVTDDDWGMAERRKESDDQQASSEKV